MNTMPNINPSKPDRFRDKKLAKILVVIAALEVIVVAGLLVWVTNSRTTLAPGAEVSNTGQQSAPEPVKTTISVQVKQVATGFASPVDIAATHDANDKRLFVVEQTGKVRVIKADRTLDPEAFLDVSGKILTGGEMGLLGLAFHPKSAENNFFYVNYIDKQQNTIVARYTIAKDTGRADPGSEKILFKIKQPYPNHNGGDLAFGSDGYLYIGLGDGGSGGDPEDRAQNKTDLLGKMLRIDVDKGKLYAIPDTNPYAKEGGKPEIWALGLRNPWRFSFDKLTGDMYIADVGQGSYEEINFQAASTGGGQNYGWRCYEGVHTFNTAACADSKEYVQPIIEYDHAEKRCSVTGGYVYRGKAYPTLADKYFYGDFCTGELFYAERNGAWKQTLATNTELAISTFGQGSDGELYVADLKGGAVYQIQTK